MTGITEECAGYSGNDRNADGSARLRDADVGVRGRRRFHRDGFPPFPTDFIPVNVRWAPIVTPVVKLHGPVRAEVSASMHETSGSDEVAHEPFPGTRHVSHRLAPYCPVHRAPPSIEDVNKRQGCPRPIRGSPYSAQVDTRIVQSQYGDNECQFREGESSRSCRGCSNGGGVSRALRSTSRCIGQS